MPVVWYCQKCGEHNHTLGGVPGRCKYCGFDPRPNDIWPSNTEAKRETASNKGRGTAGKKPWWRFWR